MKKKILIISGLFVISLAAVYIFIPAQISITQTRNINCTTNGAIRVLSDNNNWPKWWPNTMGGSKQYTGADSFYYNNSLYTILQNSDGTVEICIHNNGDTVSSKMFILALPFDSTAVQWQCTFAPSLNPVKKIQQYLLAVKIKNNMVAILDSLQSFLGKKENVYGMEISKSSFTDTVLIATRAVYHTYPSTADIYKLINTLKNYISGNNAKEINVPMMNVTVLGDTLYEMMVALPIDKELKGNGAIFPRRMVSGNFMKTEVTGGYHTVNNALNQLLFFMSDYHKTIMAIPFEVLVTDRSKETDTSKWVTKIYQPAAY